MSSFRFGGRGKGGDEEIGSKAGRSAGCDEGSLTAGLGES